MDPLTQALLNRQGQSDPSAASMIPQQPQLPSVPSSTPSIPSTPPTIPSVPPNPSTKVPQQVKRFNNAQEIMDAYRGDWTPNPVLLRAQLGHK